MSCNKNHIVKNSLISIKETILVISMRENSRHFNFSKAPGS